MRWRGKRKTGREMAEEKSVLFMAAACYKIFRAYFQAPDISKEVEREGGEPLRR